MDDSEFLIGELARRAGCRPSAIRYYESVGVLPEPNRVGGRRRYTERTVRQLQVIAVAKRAGFSLPEVRALLTSHDTESRAYTPLGELATRKLPELDALIERAQATRAWLSVARLCRCSSLEACPLFDT